ncbi:beta-N-acetylhexosaminidase [Vallitalea guaymasensis]|uniref:beta-N-acetylhexosaminidase n=1 Tax=Vallitalea guaymasensis TaxID=1185412 RepID=A0A8J8MA56_9FIRM|nr:beta-N-acetylhexosaminidase [Vallitalea guaymasensis]QUH29206.1 beta-N-acetylhexosaminidase [Vallitalea guaymasensis]
MSINIIPKPNHIILKDGVFNLNKSTKICFEDEIKPVIRFLKQYLNEASNLELQVINEPVENNVIRLSLNNALENLGKEGYKLSIAHSRIQMEAMTLQGMFYGIQTLRQIINDYPNELPCVEIEDKPRYEYRGYMLDVCRHFFDKKVVKRMIDLAALHKLNIFHWHLTEDQGFRVEIEKYKKLTEIGSKRKETIIGGKSDNTPHGGYYTASDIKEIVDYANERYITIIPEFDMPGHFLAVLASYPELSCSGKQLEVGTKFGVIKDIACAGKESTYEFIFDVLGEIIGLFPGELIHIGGDEVPKEQWIECPHCQNKINEEKLKNEEELQGYFTNRIAKFLKERNKRAITWNDALKSGNLDESVVVQHWLDGDNHKNTVKAINENRKVIMSDVHHVYLDYPYGLTPLKKTYEYKLVSAGIQKDKEKNILGVEAPLWTEYVKDLDRIDYLTFPRLSALSELGWTDEKHKNYDDFTTRLKSLNKLLDKLDVNYATKSQADVKGLKAKIEVYKHVKQVDNLLSVIRQLFINNK